MFSLYLHVDGCTCVLKGCNGGGTLIALATPLPNGRPRVFLGGAGLIVGAILATVGVAVATTVAVFVPPVFTTVVLVGVIVPTISPRRGSITSWYVFVWPLFVCNTTLFCDIVVIVGWVAVVTPFDWLNAAKAGGLK